MHRMVIVAILTFCVVAIPLSGEAETPVKRTLEVLGIDSAWLSEKDFDSDYDIKSTGCHHLTFDSTTPHIDLTKIALESVSAHRVISLLCESFSIPRSVIVFDEEKKEKWPSQGPIQIIKRHGFSVEYTRFNGDPQLFTISKKTEFELNGDVKQRDVSISGVIYGEFPDDKSMLPDLSFPPVHPLWQGFSSNHDSVLSYLSGSIYVNPDKKAISIIGHATHDYAAKKAGSMVGWLEAERSGIGLTESGKVGAISVLCTHQEQGFPSKSFCRVEYLAQKTVRLSQGSGSNRGDALAFFYFGSSAQFLSDLTNGVITRDHWGRRDSNNSIWHFDRVNRTSRERPSREADEKFFVEFEKELKRRQQHYLYSK